MFKIVFLFAAIPALALGAGLEFINCVGAPPPKEVLVDECPQRPCQLEVGKTYNVHVTAHIDKPVTALPIAIDFYVQMVKLSSIQLPTMMHARKSTEDAHLTPGTTPSVLSLQFLMFLSMRNS
uniref:Secreted protein n=1 Tax=Lutzomyia longipalpis TaxID=7200 RepID=A0A1B0CTB0_LUTLO